MQHVFSRTPRQLAFRHWLFTTGLGFVLSYLVIGYRFGQNTSSYRHSLELNTLPWAGAVTLVGAVLGLLGIWWVRLLFGWAAATSRPRLVVGLGLLLPYLVGYGLFFSGGGSSGGSLLPLVLPVWCAASLSALGLATLKSNA